MVQVLLGALEEGEIVENKHLTVTSCWFSLSLHNLSSTYSEQKKAGGKVGQNDLYSYTYINKTLYVYQN